MKYKIVYREISEYEDQVDADSAEEAIQKWEQAVDSGKVDFSFSEIVNSEIRAELQKEE